MEKHILNLARTLRFQKGQILKLFSIKIKLLNLVLKKRIILASRRSRALQVNKDMKFQKM